MKNQIVWVDIPVLDLNRAAKFYSKVLAAEVALIEEGGYQFALLPHDESNVAGCLVQAKAENITLAGPLVYLNTNGRLDEAATIVQESGGVILEEKFNMGPHGSRVVIKDSEGNRIALHSEH